MDVAEGQAVGEPAGVGGGRGVGLGRWRCGGVEVGEVEQALHRRAEPRRRTGFSWGCSPPTDGWAGRKRKRAGGSVGGTCLRRWSRGGGMLRRSSRKQSSAMAARPHASASDDPSPLRPPSLAFSSPASAATWRRVLLASPRRRRAAPRGNLNGWLAEHAQRTHDQQVYIDRNRLGVLSLKQKEALEVPNRLESRLHPRGTKLRGTGICFFFLICYNFASNST